MKGGSAILLGLSVLVNVLLIGLILGWASGANRGGPGGAPPDFGGLGPRETGAVVRMLAPRERVQVLREGEMTIRAMRQVRTEIAEARRKVRDAALAEPFDPAAFEAALDDLRAVEFGVMGRVDTVLGAALERMSLEERRALFERLATDRRGREPARRGGLDGQPEGGSPGDEAESPPVGAEPTR